MKLIDQVRTNIRAALDERNAADADVKAIVAGAEARGEDLTVEETERFNEARAKVAAIDARIAGLREREDALKADDEARAAADAVAAEVGRFEPQLKGGKAERTYTPDAERRGVSILRDLVAARVDGDPDAQQRLARHKQEARVDYGPEIEARAVGTSAFAGLVVPQYLTDLVAPRARAQRPFADICRSMPLPPDGMTVNISRVTTGTSTAVQASENASVSETNIDDTLLTVNVRTIAGQQTISRQAVDRGTGTDAVVLADLAAAYNTTLDSGIINDDGTSGTHLGLRSTSSIISVAYTDASPTAAEAYPKLADLIQQIQAGVFMGVTHFVMHPRRWWWIAKELGSTFPLLQVPGSGDRAGNLGGTDYRAVGRDIFGVPVVLDGNIPTNLGVGTNEDVILGVTADELFLWEDSNAPMMLRIDAVTTLGVTYAVYGYSAFTAGRYPGAHGTVGGTGLVTPTF